MRPFFIITPSLAFLRPVFLQKNLMAQYLSIKLFVTARLRRADLANDSKNG
jgi:hypothetical protein